MTYKSAEERIATIRKLLSKLPPEHTCKDARSLKQIYFDNQKDAARRRRMRT